MNVKELNSIWQRRLGGLSFGDAGLLSYLISWLYDEKQDNPARFRRPLPQGALIHQAGMNPDCGPMFNNTKVLFVMDGPAPFILMLTDEQVGQRMRSCTSFARQVMRNREFRRMLAGAPVDLQPDGIYV